MLSKLKELVKKAWNSWSAKDAYYNVMYYLRIHDEEGKLSLTNLALMVVLAKVAMAPTASMSDVTALALGVFGYAFKKHVNTK